MKRLVFGILILFAVCANAQTIGDQFGTQLNALIARLEAVETAVGSGQIPADLEGRVQSLENTLAAQDARILAIETALKKPILGSGNQ